MTQRVLESWLRKRLRREAAGLVIAGLGSAFGSVVVVALTICFAFVSLSLAVSLFLAVFEFAGLALPPVLSFWRWLLAGSIGFVALLFASQSTKGKEAIPEITWVSPLGPEMIGAAARIITDWLFSGPQLAAVALEFGGRSIRLLRTDVAWAADVLALLAATDSRVSFREICDRIPGLNPVRIFPQFHNITGVVFVTADPAGLSLTSEFRDELRAVLGTAEPFGEPEMETADDDDSSSVQNWAFRVLDLAPSASIDEVKAAYRRLMKEHHPDRVAKLSEDLRAFAEEKTKEINQAYDQIVREHARNGAGRGSFTDAG
jgi:hypothetical protein